jgi:hypothetical protein
MTTLYISGPMSGESDFNRPAFRHAEQQLRAAGFNVINPAQLILNPPDDTWNDYMAHAVIALKHVDGIALLDRWRWSAGALMEMRVALRNSIPHAPVAQWLKPGTISGGNINLPGHVYLNRVTEGPAEEGTVTVTLEADISRLKATLTELRQEAERERAITQRANQILSKDWDSTQWAEGADS